MTKADIELKNIIQDPFFTTLKDFLNDSNLANIIEEVLEVVQNDIVSFDDEFANNTTFRIEIINKMYKNYIKEMTAKDKIMLKSVICLALECLNIILSMIYTQVFNEKNKSQLGKQPYHQHHQTSLLIIQYIKDALLTSSTLADDLDDNKLLLTIVSYINFENRYDIQENNRYIDDEFEDSIVFFETNQNVSSVAFKTLMEILRIWELYPISKRPSLSSYLTYDNNAFSYVDEIIKKSFENPETVNCFLEFLVMCMNSQTAFINILFKNERIFDNIIGIFCKNVEFTIMQARECRVIKRLVGMLFILISNLIQNSKIKFSNPVKEMIREFLTAYISNSNDTIHKLFINRDDHKKEHFEMTIVGFGFKKEEEQLNPDKREIILEQSVKDICFYNHVLASYILIVAHLLISIDKDPENKKQALKCLSFMFKGQIFEILEL